MPLVVAPSNIQSKSLDSFQVKNQVALQQRHGFAQKLEKRCQAAKMTFLEFDEKLRAVQPLPSTPPRPRTVPTATDIYARVASIIPAPSRESMRTEISLEEVLAAKLKQEADKFMHFDSQAARIQMLDRPVSPKPKGSNPFLRDSIPIATSAARRQKNFQHRTTKFAEQVDLPSLGIALTTGTLQQEFNFARLPNREKSLSKKPGLSLERSFTSESPSSDWRKSFDMSASVPPSIIHGEPFLQYLMEKTSQGKSVTSPGKTDAPDPEPIAITEEAGDGEEARPIEQEGEAAPPDAEGTGAEQASEQLKKNASELKDSPQKDSSRNKSTSRPSSAVAPPNPDFASMRLIKDCGTKRKMLRNLVNRQNYQEQQLRVLEERRQQIAEVQQQIDALQQSQLSRLQASGALEPGVEVVIPAELEAQLQSLQSQQDHIEDLHAAITQAHATQAQQIRAQREAEALAVQGNAQRQLSMVMQRNTHMQSVARYRQQQRQQRSNALLWNRNRYERRAGGEAGVTKAE
eukprot:NODE_1048_length_1740_cov_51.988173_g925_i0.p1 GENE.NODE_1048_length_1740_cov_51.988173_g925_i0~~NODE_1048_length_1740_cov_51.988173_g925_i0.p1  ORF type:complete len:518 (+),score=127.64 NODE_1048_length_1740_cov_51.988173_g925_i0:100-1653(+)